MIGSAETKTMIRAIPAAIEPLSSPREPKCVLKTAKRAVKWKFTYRNEFLDRKRVIEFLYAVR